MGQHIGRWLMGGLLMASCVAGVGQDARSPAKLSSETLARTISKPVKVDFFVRLPRGHRTQGQFKWPVLLFLHGAGERGSDLEKVKVHGPPKVMDRFEDLEMILVAPQCPEGEIWDDATVLALLDEAIYRYRGDPTRVYLTGLSMGGYGSWSLATKYPERFAAVAPVCGGGSTLPIKLANGTKKEALVNLPIWAFHGAKDGVVALSESERLVESLRKIGAKDVKLTVYPEAGHDAWTETYNNPELYRWFLSHSTEHRAVKK